MKLENIQYDQENNVLLLNDGDVKVFFSETPDGGTDINLETTLECSEDELRQLGEALIVYMKESIDEFNRASNQNS